MMKSSQIHGGAEMKAQRVRFLISVSALLIGLAVVATPKAAVVDTPKKITALLVTPAVVAAKKTATKGCKRLHCVAR